MLLLLLDNIQFHKQFYMCPKIIKYSSKNNKISNTTNYITITLKIKYDKDKIK